ncbi:unnamed protein product (macronuclear) [Paramecium tetraurelia]|uniref:Uncharacterized protein n=1 Tax=Paramecium tetraurelia TaxID=5888 RepID=A0DPJ6_PARTE|nr:uncharacterized protein GSPATT00019145001 [Paramecium tetraurelia]CAK84963.1 unnamed protein product [Paramecium tetraurelia]|eukprot:XP_001452360.1 hypothetical protein (macronuclear) [Paramecium tetraurelia strain d4-2]
MKSSDLLQQFNDFRRNLKAQIQSNEITKTPQKNYIKTQSSPQKLSSRIKSKINLTQNQNKNQDRCNTNQSIQNNNQLESLKNNSKLQCITHEKLSSKQQNVQSFKSSNCSNKKELTVNKLISQEQLQKLCSTFQSISDEEVKQLPNEYKQLLKQLSTFVNAKFLK